MQLTKNGGGKLRQLLTNIPTNDIEEIEMKVRVKVQKGFRSW